MIKKRYQEGENLDDQEEIHRIIPIKEENDEK